jgi:DnaA family protein
MQQQLLPGIAATPAPTLDNFAAGRNLELLESLRSLAAGSARERFFYLWGEDGSGKSHLLQAVADAARQRGMSAIYTQTPAECDGFHLVALDNADCLDEAAQIELFNLYNRLRDGNGCLLASGTLPPAQLAVRPDLSTRLGWGLVFRVQPLSDEEKAAALAAHARERGFALPSEVSGYLLRHWRRDLPSLMAVLEELDRYSMERQRPVSAPLLRELLGKRT